MGNATVWNCGFAKSVPKVLRKRFPQFSYGGASQSSRILVSPIATPINTCCAAQGSKLQCLCHTHRLKRQRGHGGPVQVARGTRA